MKLLELFAGSRSVWKVAEKLWYEVFSVDYVWYKNIDLEQDIETLTPQQIPWIPDVIWASFDCTTYSIAAVSYHRSNTITPISEYANKCDRVNTSTIKLIKYYLKLNPKLKFYIENPVGMLRKMPFMLEFHRETVWYCQYWDTRAKPTDIFTNDLSFKWKKCHNKRKDTNWVIIDHCHHQSAPRWSKTWTQWLKWSYDRSKIPKELCIEILTNTPWN